MFMTQEPIDPLLDDTIKQLWLLARGDFDLVEEAVISSLEQKRNGWLQPKSWQVNIEAATKFIVNRRNELEAIKPQDDVSDV